ncbi:hypothetical protein QYF36_000773 [Acer negundo]|nr:hypothetical protein QYF36_000773 [Acer negundo]
MLRKEIESKPGMENHDEKKHFVLVHGACNGAWCWYKVLTLLESSGHRVTAIDLGAFGVNLKRLDEIASVSNYIHIPIESLLDTQLTFENGMEKPPNSAIFGPDYLKTTMYKLCSLEDLEQGKMLVRPTGLFVEDFSKEGKLTKEKFGSVNRVFVFCKEDDVVTEEFQQMMIDNYHPKETKIIDGAGHMAMFSKPRQLCQISEDVANKYH